MTYLVDDIGDALQSNNWVFAKSMGDKPHWYTLRDKWKSEISFDDIVKFIRAQGTPRKFFRATFVYFKYENHEYWTMGSPVDETTLINRAYIGPSIKVSLDGCFISSSESTFSHIRAQAEILKMAHDSLKESKNTFRTVSLVDDYSQPVKHFFDYGSLDEFLSQLGISPVKSYSMRDMSDLNHITVSKIRDSGMKARYTEIIKSKQKHPLELSLATWYLFRLGVIEYGLPIRPAKKLLSIITDPLRANHESAIRIVEGVAGNKTLSRIEEVSPA